jgi:hypothetical protein
LEVRVDDEIRNVHAGAQAGVRLDRKG